MFLDTVEKLKPKIVVAENVTGLLMGNAKGYVNEIIKRFHELGYEVQLYKLNAALMNVPQTRERVFFIANNQHYPKLKMIFNEKPILFKEVKSENGYTITQPETRRLVKYLHDGETNLSIIKKRIGEKENGYGKCVLWEYRVPMTIVSGNSYIRGDDKKMASDEDIRNISTFPQDYDFGDESVQYMCGMSVPPNMMANIATEIYKQWISKTVK